MHWQLLLPDKIKVPDSQPLSVWPQVFLALHADALAEGEAVGATVYTLADDASDKASATLAERHNRDDLLAGIDLSQQDVQSLDHVRFHGSTYCPSTHTPRLSA